MELNIKQSKQLFTSGHHVKSPPIFHAHNILQSYPIRILNPKSAITHFPSSLLGSLILLGSSHHTSSRTISPSNQNYTTTHIFKYPILPPHNLILAHKPTSSLHIIPTLSTHLTSSNHPHFLASLVHAFLHTSLKCQVIPAPSYLLLSCTPCVLPTTRPISEIPKNIFVYLG
jgi:hypothetical protein